MADQPVFSVTEMSGAEGITYCWVVEDAGSFSMYGNEAGRMSGPCRSVFWAVRSANGFQFGMDHTALEASISPDELRRILSSLSFDLARVASLTINGVNVDHVTVDEIVRVYCSLVSA